MDIFEREMSEWIIVRRYTLDLSLSVNICIKVFKAFVHAERKPTKQWYVPQ